MPLTLYSTVTRLAYLIGQRYYDQQHYVWCAPGESGDRFDPKNPSSSHPIKLYRDYLIDVEGGDMHSALITQNRIGLAKGAEAKLLEGVITRDERDRVLKIVDKAGIDEFIPLLLVIPYSGVKGITSLVDIDDRARASSEEYIITHLPRGKFDILRLSEIRK